MGHIWLACILNDRPGVIHVKPSTAVKAVPPGDIKNEGAKYRRSLRTANSVSTYAGSELLKEILYRMIFFPGLLKNLMVSPA